MSNPFEKLINAICATSCRPLFIYFLLSFLIYSIPAQHLCTTIPYLNTRPLPRIPLTELKQEGLDLTLNEVNYLHYLIPQLAGRGMQVSIKENLYDTTDIDFAARDGNLNLASSYIDAHASSIATIVAGGGNSDPSAKGVAWQALISSSDFKQLLPDPDNYFIDNSIYVQNHAYGTGIENYYGIESVHYDAQAYRLPQLLHVFSSGNSGHEAPPDGTYESLSGWANLTGQFKQSKNTLTVGATDSLDRVVSLSSRGPAYDGRIKPEVVAYGHGGSSGAAAIVSGIAILFQQAYKNTYGSYPPASLIKASLINAARDIESSAPDFVSGYGSVRAPGTINTIYEERFLVDKINNLETKSISLDIPLHTGEAKFTLAWTDPPDTIYANTSLVNDIDIVVETPLLDYIFPWVLNSNPNADSLVMLASRGIDSINNVEQITLDNPPAGQYTLHVVANSITNQPQEFSLVWNFTDTTRFEWTFPTSNDFLRKGQKNIIRWNAYSKAIGTIEFREIGENWQTIAVDIDPRSHAFNLPSTNFNGLAQLRWISSNQIVESDTFVITSPLNPNVVLLCEDSLIFNWSRQGADQFEILRMENMYLEPVDLINDTFYIIINPEESNPYYAVVPVYSNIKGPNSYAFNYQLQGTGCYVNSFYTRHIINGTAYFSAELGTLNNVSSVFLEKNQDGTFNTILNVLPLDSITLLFETDMLSQGVNEFRLKIVLETGEIVYSHVEQVFYNNHHEIIVFPNPVASGLPITIYAQNIDDFNLRIYDMQGKEVFSQDNFNSPAVLINHSLIPGNYFIQIISEDQVRFSELISVF